MAWKASVVPTQLHSPRYMAWMDYALTDCLTVSHILFEFGLDVTTDDVRILLMASEILRLRNRMAEDEWTSEQFAHFPTA